MMSAFTSRSLITSFNATQFDTSQCDQWYERRKRKRSAYPAAAKSCSNAWNLFKDGAKTSVLIKNESICSVLMHSKKLKDYPFQFLKKICC